jgi:hypothetical protein
MEITTVAPALYANRAASNDLEDITHTCVHCGATLIRTRRPFTSTPTPERNRSDFCLDRWKPCFMHPGGDRYRQPGHQPFPADLGNR